MQSRGLRAVEANPSVVKVGPLPWKQSGETVELSVKFPKDGHGLSPANHTATFEIAARIHKGPVKLIARERQFASESVGLEPEVSNRIPNQKRPNLVEERLHFNNAVPVS